MWMEQTILAQGLLICIPSVCVLVGILFCAGCFRTRTDLPHQQEVEARKARKVRQLPAMQRMLSQHEEQQARHKEQPAASDSTGPGAVVQPAKTRKQSHKEQGPRRMDQDQYQLAHELFKRQASQTNGSFTDRQNSVTVTQPQSKPRSQSDTSNRQSEVQSSTDQDSDRRARTLSQSQVSHADSTSRSSGFSTREVEQPRRMHSHEPSRSKSARGGTPDVMDKDNYHQAGKIFQRQASQTHTNPGVCIDPRHSDRETAMVDLPSQRPQARSHAPSRSKSERGGMPVTMDKDHYHQASKIFHRQASQTNRV